MGPQSGIIIGIVTHPLVPSQICPSQHLIFEQILDELRLKYLGSRARPNKNEKLLEMKTTSNGR
jgi:hypothetical protein